MIKYTPTLRKKQAPPDDAGASYLKRRRIAPQTASYFRITFTTYDDRPALTYPVLDAEGRSAPRGRVKFIGGVGQKYAWTGDKDVRPPTFYHAAGLQHVRANSGELVIASGEVDLWTLWQAGIRAVVSWFGEGQRPAGLVELLRSSGVRRVVTFTDRDRTGDAMAAWLRDLLAGTGIDYVPRRLPGAWRPASGTDVNAIWCGFDGNEDDFRRFLSSLPLLNLPRRSEPTRRQPAPSAHVSDASERDEVRRRVCAAIHTALKPRRKKERTGYYECPFPDHGPGGKDFLFDPTTGRVGGCQGKHAGLLRRWTDLAHFLDIDVSGIARQVAAERRADITSRASSHQIAADTPVNRTTDSPRHFASGFPTTLHQFLLAAHRDPWLADLPDLATAALTWSVWTECVNAGALAPDAWLTSAGLRLAAAECGWRVGRKTTEHGLELLVDLGVWEKRDYDAQSASGSGRGRRADCQYRAKPLTVALDDMWRVLGSRVRQRAFAENAAQTVADDADVLITTFVGDGGLDRAEAASLVSAVDARRADVYAQQARARADAKTTYRRRLATLRQKYSYLSLASGSAVVLPRGDLNARSYRRMLWLNDLDARGGRRHPDDAATARYRVGASRQHVCRWRRREHVLAVPQWREIEMKPCSESVLSQLASVDARAAAKLRAIELVSSGGRRLRLSERELGDAFLAEAFAVGESVTARIRQRSAEVREAVAEPQERRAAETEHARLVKLYAFAAGSAGVVHQRRTFASLHERFTAEYHIRQASLSLDERYTLRGVTIRDETTGELFDLTPLTAWLAAAGASPDRLRAASPVPEPDDAAPSTLPPARPLYAPAPVVVAKPRRRPPATPPDAPRGASPALTIMAVEHRTSYPYPLAKTPAERAAERALFERIDAEEAARREYALAWSRDHNAAKSCDE